MERQQLFSPFESFVAGRSARQAHDYGATRNKLAELDLANAPAQMQQRNALADIELRGAQQQLNAEQAKFAYAKLLQAKDSGNPKAFILSQIPDLAAKLQSQGHDIRSMDEADVADLTDQLARRYAGEAGIAPSQPAQMTPYQQAQIKLERDKMNAPKTMSPYEAERIKIEREKLKQPQGDTGPLVQISGPDGKPIYATRDEARGKPAYVAPTAANTAPNAQQKKLSDAKDVTDIIAIAEPLIAKATNSYIGAGADQFARAFGKSTEGGAAISQLKAIQAALMLKMPRMEGPQSNLDVQLYREAAGQIGDPTVPAENKLAALNAVKQIQAKYIENAGGGGTQSPATNSIQSSQGEVRVSSPQEAMALPPGTVFITPDGRRKVR